MQDFPSSCTFQHLVYQRNLSLSNSPKPSPVPQQADDESTDSTNKSYYQTFMGLNYGAITGLIYNAISYYLELPPILNTLHIALNIQFLILTALCSVIGALIGYYLDCNNKTLNFLHK
jgi:hypothetical protein